MYGIAVDWPAMNIPWTTDTPTQPGTYWFKRKPTDREGMIDVRETDGELMVTVNWTTPDEPVTASIGVR